MQKNNSTVKKKSKSVSRNALQIIIQELALPDSQKVKLYEDLRCMGITDDNDPLIKFTMLQGLLAQYNDGTAEKIVRERKNIEDTVETVEDTVETIKELYKHFYNAILELRKRDLAELKDSIKLWENKAIIGAQEVIVEMRYEEERLRKQNKKEQEKLDKAKEEIYEAQKERDEIKNSCTNYIAGTIVVCLFVILISGGIISLIWNCEKNSKVEKYSEAVENRNTEECSKPTLKVTDSQSDLDLKYKKYQEELDNEPDLEKRLEMLKKMLNVGEEKNDLR